jgi:ankyrin repeat protein
LPAFAVHADQTDEHGRSALHAAAHAGFADIVALLLLRSVRARACVNVRDLAGATPLFLAVCSVPSQMSHARIRDIAQ